MAESLESLSPQGSMTMNQPTTTRRDCLAALAGTLAASTLLPAGDASAGPVEPPGASPFLYALNTSTISGRKLPLAEKIAIASKAGYDGIEPWVREIEAHVAAGGSLDDLAKQIRDLNLRVVDAIGFFEWAVDDDLRRSKGLEEARRNMAMVARIGGLRIAAPPFGATDRPGLDLDRAADRYRFLLEIGEREGVTPLVEVWGFSKNIATLAQAAHVAIGADHPGAAILADVYHLHKGGSGFGGLGLLGGGSVPVLHINDYPAGPVERLSDADRVYPGDGVAPLDAILESLRKAGGQTALSLELFNRDYWKLDPAEVASTGLSKMKAAVEASMARPTRPA